uniref:CCDC113/CCDC96 coiled-coil domain-containing protein n=1 Tax=Calidris pygmaea TaxID=425635 RepID=A0A8C3PN77_9CHAR
MAAAGGPERPEGPGEPGAGAPTEPPGPSEASESEVAAGPPGPSEPSGPSEVAEAPPGPSEPSRPSVAEAPPRPSEASGHSEVAEAPPGPSEPEAPPRPSEALGHSEVAEAPREPSEPEVAEAPPRPLEASGHSEVAEAPPGLSESSEPEVAEAPLGPSDQSGPSEVAPAAGGAGEEEEKEKEEEEEAASGGAGGPPSEATPAARAPEAPGPPVEAAVEAEESEEERRERAELLEQHRGLAVERERLRQASARLQLRLGELLRLRRGARRREEARAEAVQRYGELLRRLQELRELRERTAAACREREEAGRRRGEERQGRAQAEWAAFQARKKTMALFSLGRRLGGREGAARTVERIQVREGEKEQQARVENIKLKHEIQNLETILKAQGELAEGQQFMDFEHMKKENQKYSKKIDDLSEEILKLKKKVSNAVHILSQFREKLQFMEAANQDRRAELMNIETVLSQKRDILTRTKQVRDRLRRNNLKLQEKCGLLGNEILLWDFEKKMDTAELLSQRLETLKRHHAGLILTRRAIQKKIREANSSFLAKEDLRKESMAKNKPSGFP